MNEGWQEGMGLRKEPGGGGGGGSREQLPPERKELGDSCGLAPGDMATSRTRERGTRGALGTCWCSVSCHGPAPAHIGGFVLPAARRGAGGQGYSSSAKGIEQSKEHGGGPHCALQPPSTVGDAGSGCQMVAEGSRPLCPPPGTTGQPFPAPFHCPHVGQAQTPPPLPWMVTQSGHPPAWGPRMPTYLCGAGAPHCCLQVESLRILLLAEQALREGLDEALARRSALDLVLSCPVSVPFMHTALGSPLPRLCPFCPASSSGTCPAREGGR